jgi:FkbM family methyltransferase
MFTTDKRMFGQKRYPMALISRLVSGALRTVGIYEAVRYSRTYYQVLRWTHPVYYRQLLADAKFYQRLFQSRIDMAFDIGANCGDKTFVFLNIANKIVACEPEPVSFSRLRRRFQSLEIVALEQCAIGDRSGNAVLFQSNPGSAYNSLNSRWREPSCVTDNKVEIEVRIMTLDELIRKHGMPDYVKLDVEGYEWPAIQGLTPQIAVLSFEANIPQFYAETLLILDRLSLKAVGSTIQIRQGDDFIFPGRYTVREAVEWLKIAQPGSYELFVFSGTIGKPGILQLLA